MSSFFDTATQTTRMWSASLHQYINITASRPTYPPQQMSMPQPQQLPPPGVAATNCFPAGFAPNQQYYSHMPGMSQPGYVSTPGVAATNRFSAGAVPHQQQYYSHMSGRSQPGAVNAPGVAATNCYPSPYSSPYAQQPQRFSQPVVQTAFVPKPMFQNARRHLAPFTPGFQQQSGIIDATTNGQRFDLTREVPPTWPTPPAVPIPAAPIKRKRQSGVDDEVPKVPKKRGRPPKAKPENEVPKVPKKRGRPPKVKPVVVVQEPTPDITTTTTTTTNSSLEEDFAFDPALFADFMATPIDALVEAGPPCRLQERGQDSTEAVEPVENLPASVWPADPAAESTWADPPMHQELWIGDVAPADDFPAFTYPEYTPDESLWADPPLPEDSEIVEQDSFGPLMDDYEARAAADDEVANAATDDFLRDYEAWNW